MDVDASSNASSSQPTSPSNDNRATRSSTTLSRNLDPDPEKIASLAQKLYDSVKALKSSKSKTNVTIPLQDLENILSRSQQVALLTAAAPRRTSRDDVLSLQISDMSNRLSSQLDNLESQLGKTLHSAPGIEPTHPPSTSSPSVLNGTRHSSLYLTDGNLVVAAEGAGGKVLFRVHQSILSLQSPVFSSMFTLPHPGGSANRDMYDGAPFVHMQDDAKDVEALLKVLYNPSELPYKRLDPLTPINVRRTLGMATKYGMEPLRDRIVAQLEADWPNSLAEWDRLETEVHALTKEHKSSEGFMVDGLYLDERLPEPGSAIRLAIDWSIPKILPAAFYHLSRLSTDADWLECRKPRENLCLSRTVRWDLLQASDLKLLLKLREAITGYESLYTTPSKLCHSSQVCDDWWDQTCLRWDHAKDPLDSMKRFVETRPTRGLCKPCWNATKDAVQQRRLELWDEICDCVEEHTK